MLCQRIASCLSLFVVVAATWRGAGAAHPHHHGPLGPVAHHHHHHSYSPTIRFSVGVPSYSYGFSSTYYGSRWPSSYSYSVYSSYRPTYSCYRPSYSYCAPGVNWSSYYAGYYDSFSYYRPTISGIGVWDFAANVVPQAIEVNRQQFAQPLVQRPLDRLDNAIVANKPADELLPNGRESSHATSRRYLAEGDRLFAAGRHHEALAEYKKATAFASDEAQGYFRQGFALIATKRYEMAVMAFRNGLAAEPGYVASRFRLDEIYQAREAEKQDHFDSLASAALDNPRSGSLLFATGVMLHFDGQQDRANKFLTRAGELSPADERYAKSFLKNDQPASSVAERPQGRERDL